MHIFFFFFFPIPRNEWIETFNLWKISLQKCICAGGDDFEYFWNFVNIALIDINNYIYNESFREFKQFWMLISLIIKCEKS